MKKITLVLAGLICSSTAIAGPTIVKINNTNPGYKMIVKYKACFRNLGSHKSPCLQEPHQATIKKGQKSQDIELPEYTEYARVISAIAKDDKDISIAEGKYPGEEDCKAFEYHPVTLDTIEGNKIILCTRS